MNAKLFHERPLARLGAFACMLAWTGTAAAAGPLDRLGAAIADPFATRPPVLDHGHPLPGDTAVLGCSVASVGSRPLGLERAVDLALCSNPKIRNAWLGIKVQAATLGVAEAAFLPTISANLARERSATGYPDSLTRASFVSGNTAYASLNWRLFDFGERGAERASANFALLAAIESHDAMLQKVMEDTIQAYFDAQSAFAAWQNKEEDEQIASATLASATRRESRGAMAAGDTLQAARAQARASLERNRALGDYRKACAVLVYMMGMPADAEIVLATIEPTAEASPRKPQRSRDDLAAWLQEVRRTHPSILAARSQWDAALATVKASEAAGRPTVDFSANYYRNGYPNQGISGTGSRVGTVGVAISFPIFSGFSHTYKVRQTAALAEQRENDVLEAEHDILIDLVKAYTDTRFAYDDLDASSLLLTAAQDALLSSQRKYDKGAADMIEMLTSQKELADAKQERVRAISDWRSARLRLMAAAGQLGREQVTASAGMTQ